MNIVSHFMRGQILSLSWPVVLEMTGVMLVGLIVTAMVGQLGAVSLAAVGLATVVQMSAAMVFAAAGTGAAAIIAREAGARQWETVRRITGQAITLALIFGLFLAAIGYLGAELIFQLVDADPSVAQLAGSLLKIVFLVSPTFLVMSVGCAILRGVGRTRDSFLISLLNNGLNIAISYLAIFGIGLPAAGVYGAAWGIVSGQVTGGIAAVVMLMHQPLIRLSLKDMTVYRPDDVRRILRISLPAGMEQLAMQGGRVAFTFLLAGVGPVQFAAHQIAMQVESISFLPGFAFSVAAMTLVGQSLGRHIPHRAEQYARLTRTMAIGLMSGLGFVFIFFSQPLTRLFIQDPAVIAWGSACVMIAAAEQPTLALYYVMAGALRGAGDTKWPMYVTAVGVWLVRIPLVYLFIEVWGYAITAAWWITALDFLLRSAVMWHRFRAGKWKEEGAC
ncbi:MATE family efflux transporter [Acetonema longum]|uniref:Probable multidrug resistance protein NorM n=1 Tax=Acetonema longum DSM 6540 TaxID=1009370 RepID=F7NJE1_9FIRM|nr:MATE family efflux transporter [Acetonema longum]EGO63889.1 MATE efflux family protein [Acetonema longum DSM 6540]